jgi:hypothetical protein
LAAYFVGPGPPLLFLITESGSIFGGKADSIDMNIRSEIADEFRRVAQDQGRELAPLTDDLELLESGLDSFSFAIIVARLEELLGEDPFSTSEDVLFPVTFGDFVSFYEEAAKQAK